MEPKTLKNILVAKINIIYSLLHYQSKIDYYTSSENMLWFIYLQKLNF